MRLRKIILLIVVSLPALLLLTPALAQGPDGQPRRLTFDGHSTPIGWEADGLRVMRPGALLDEAGRQRIASQLWRIAPADGRAELIAADSPPAERELTSRSATRAVTVIAAMSTAPELWVSLADGSQPRRLLTSDSEYFGPPLFAPDGSRFVFTRTPRGSETHGLSAIWAADADGQNILSLVAEASAPVWSPDGAQIAFEHQGDVYVASARTPITGWPRVEKPAPLIPAPLALTEPATIRVSHDINNTCRPGVPAGQIDTYAFETYLTYVVPTEISASDPTEQLKVQAVASRTYAWNEILGSGGSSYDVTDWTLSQAMCPNKVDARSTAAVTATVGQYVAYGGALIDTLYSAENGDPTLSNWFSSCCQQYLAAVDDPVSFGYTRSGHGIGMSQNGANRWALTYGWDYIQILTHYYSSVTIEGPTNFGAFNAPWNNRYLNANRARIVAATSNNSRLSVYARGSGLTNTLVTTNALVSALDLTNLPDQPLGSLFITATLSNTQVATLTLGLDRAPPTGTLSVPHLTTSLTVTAQLSGTDSGSGFAGYGMSNNWIWEGEKQYSLTVGTVVSDAAALNGQAMYAPASGNGGVVYSPYAAALYGPYTFGLPVGPSYRAYFRLKTNNVITTAELGYMDVITNYNLSVPVGIKRIYGTDFRAANAYQEFFVDFTYPSATVTGLEFRLWLYGSADLWLDRVLVARYPATSPLTTTWVLSAPLTTGTVVAKFADSAGNISADVAPLPPPFTTRWLTATQALTITAQDMASGLDITKGKYRLSSNGGVTWTNWLTASVSGISGTTAAQTISATAATSDGIGQQVQFQMGNVKGITATSPLYVFNVDSQPPAVVITSLVISTTAISVVWAGQDALSGVASFDVQSQDVAGGVWQDWLTATTSTTGIFIGQAGSAYQFRVRARDQAGNLSNYFSSFLYLPILIR